MNAAETLVSLNRECRPKFFRLTHDWASADDLAQIASLKWWENYLATGTLAPLRFMLVVGYNYFCDSKRKQAREQCIQQDSLLDPRESHVDALEQDELLTLVVADLKHLACAQKHLIEQVYLHAQPQKTVAEVVGLPHPTIRSRLKRGLDQLRKRFAS